MESAPDRSVFTVKVPLGVVVVPGPWNLPMAMALRKSRASLVAGCPMIVKPSPETPFTTLSLAYLAEKTGFGPGCFTVITTDLEDNTPSLCEAIYLEQAISRLMALKVRHAGQKFAETLAAATRKLELGHATAKNTTMRPVTIPQFLTKLQRQVDDCKQHGGKVLVGGQQVDIGKGKVYFFAPTILVDMDNDMLVIREETFGPICAPYKSETEEEVVKYANDSCVGLGKLLFTKSVGRTWRFLENLQEAMVPRQGQEILAEESNNQDMDKESGKDVAAARISGDQYWDIEYI
ncbi:hypothetical protein LTS17_005293 [Exophiala oligosperma]